MTPKVSVLIPVYNGAGHVGAALDSVLGQTFHDFECMVVDDGSTDETPAILESYAERDPRVRVIRGAHQGIVAALNQGLAEVRGTWVARMDADDLCLPNRLRAQMELASHSPQLDVIAGKVIYGGDPGQFRGLALYVDWCNGLIEADQIAQQRFVESPLIHPSVTFKTELVRRFGAYRDGLFPEDYELWLRWLEAGVRMGKVREDVLIWQERSSRLTRTDERYAVDAFYRMKAEYLTRWLKARSAERIYIWGAGKTTRKRARHLQDLGVKVIAWVDIDANKIGNRVQGLPVISPEQLPPPDGAFVVAMVGSRGARSLITDYLQNHGFMPLRHYICAA